MALFNKPDDALQHGVHLAGTKFFTLSANERSVYGKKAVGTLVSYVPPGTACAVVSHEQCG